MMQQQMAPFDFNYIYLILQRNWGLAVLLILLYLIWKYAGDVGSFFKDYFNKKVDVESKKRDELQKTNDKLFGLYENNTAAVVKVGEAIQSFERAFISSEARTSEKILGVESRIRDTLSGVETRLTEKITSKVHHDKLDKIVHQLEKSEEEIYGDHK